MALLKGGSYVDGDFYVEDSIRAHNIQDLDGKNFPYVDSAQTANYKDRIIRFSNDESGIVPAKTSIVESNTKTTIDFPGQTNGENNHALQIEAQSKNLKIRFSDIELNSDGTAWQFK